MGKEVSLFTNVITEPCTGVSKALFSGFAFLEDIRVSTVTLISYDARIPPNFLLVPSTSYPDLSTSWYLPTRG